MELNNHNYIYDFLLCINMYVLFSCDVVKGFCPLLNGHNINILVYDFLQYAFAILHVL